MMNTIHGIKKGRFQEILKELAATFLQEQSSGKALITVTDCRATDNMRGAKIFFTVLPAEHEEEALNFAKRQRRDFRDYIKSQCKLRRVPFIDFEIDQGEKNRQRLDEISLQ